MWRRTPASADAGTRAERLAGAIRTIADFPRPGIAFRDITTLLADAVAFHETVDAIAAEHVEAGVDLVAGVEARGFILGAPVAHVLGTGFVPIRKQGRLPAATVSASYALEYGEAVLEVHADSVRRGQRVLIVDDLLATGGTAGAAIDLVERLGGEVVALAFLIELTDLDGASALGGRPHTALVAL